MSVVVKVTPKKKTGRGRKPRPSSVKDFCRLCSCCFKLQYGEPARSIATENLFQSSNERGIIGVVLAKLCEDVGLKVTDSTTLSDRVCFTCARKIRNMHQLYSFVAYLRWEKMKETKLICDSSAAFPHLFLHLSAALLQERFKKRLTSLHDSYSSWHLYICRLLFGLSTFL